MAVICGFVDPLLCNTTLQYESWNLSSMQIPAVQPEYDPFETREAEPV
jgi:hypothetical protein